ncbi:hypothetical protein [Chamaesiphon sp. VAR_69_metabat_338]
MGVAEIEEFLTHLAVEGKVTAATKIRASQRFYFCTAKFYSRN